MNGFEKIEERMRRHQVFPRIVDASDRPVQTTLSRLSQKGAKGISFVPGFVAQGSRLVPQTSKADPKSQEIQPLSTFGSPEFESDNLREPDRYPDVEETNFILAEQEKPENILHEEEFGVTSLSITFNDQESGNDHIQAKPTIDSTGFLNNSELNSEKSGQLEDVKKTRKVDSSSHLQMSQGVNSRSLDSSEFKPFVNDKEDFKTNAVTSTQKEIQYRDEIDDENKFMESFYKFDIKKIEVDFDDSYLVKNELVLDNVSEISFSYSPNSSAGREEKAEPFSLMSEVPSESEPNSSTRAEVDEIKLDYAQDFSTSLIASLPRREIDIYKEAPQIDVLVATRSVIEAPLVQSIGREKTKTFSGLNEKRLVQNSIDSRAEINIQSVDDTYNINSISGADLEQAATLNTPPVLEGQEQRRGSDGSPVFFDELGNDVVVFNPPRHDLRKPKSASKAADVLHNQDTGIIGHSEKSAENEPFNLESKKFEYYMALDSQEERSATQETKSGDIKVPNKEAMLDEERLNPNLGQLTAESDSLEAESEDRISSIKAFDDFSKIADIQVVDKNVENASQAETNSGSVAAENVISKEVIVINSDLAESDVLDSKPDLSVFSMPLPKLIRPPAKQKSKSSQKELETVQEDAPSQARELASADFTKILAEIQELKKFQQDPNSYEQQDLNTNSNSQTVSSVNVPVNSPRTPVPDDVLREIEAIKKVLNPQYNEQNLNLLVQANRNTDTENVPSVDWEKPQGSSSNRSSVPDDVLRQIEEIKKLSNPQPKSGALAGQTPVQQSVYPPVRSNNSRSSENTLTSVRGSPEKQEQTFQALFDSKRTSEVDAQYLSADWPRENPEVIKEGLSRLTSTLGNTVQISERTRRFLKPLVGIDPSEVKIVDGEAARAITQNFQADALTVGETILLPNGNTDSPESIALIAHELTHVARNRDSRFVPAMVQKNSTVFQTDEEAVALQVESQVRAFVEADQQMRAQASSSVTDSSIPTPQISDAKRSQDFGEMPAPWELPDWMRNPELPMPTNTRAESVSVPSSAPVMPNIPAPMAEAPSFIQAAAQNRAVPAAPPAPSAQLQKRPDENEAGAGAAPAPDLDELAQQVYRRLKRRIAEEQRRQSF
jgi:Domain of unknown function (DUF4157)